MTNTWCIKSVTAACQWQHFSSKDVKLLSSGSFWSSFSSFLLPYLWFRGNNVPTRTLIRMKCNESPMKMFSFDHLNTRNKSALGGTAAVLHEIWANAYFLFHVYFIWLTVILISWLGAAWLVWTKYARRKWVYEQNYFIQLSVMWLWTVFSPVTLSFILYIDVYIRK